MWKEAIVTFEPFHTHGISKMFLSLLSFVFPPLLLPIIFLFHILPYFDSPSSFHFFLLLFFVLDLLFIPHLLLISFPSFFSLNPSTLLFFFHFYPEYPDPHKCASRLRSYHRNWEEVLRKPTKITVNIAWRKKREHLARVGSTPLLYQEWSVIRFSAWGLSWYSPGPPSTLLDSYCLKLLYDRFLPYLFQFNLYLSLYLT
jgi:hypothetical protein